MLDRTHGAHRALREFEHQRRGDRAVGIHELEELGKIGGVRQRRSRDIAEQPDVPVLEQQPAHHLHAAEDHEVVDLRHQAGAFGLRNERSRVHHLAALVAQPRYRLVVAHLALRQRDDRLQIEIDTIGVDGLPDQRQRRFLARHRAGRRGGLRRRRAPGLGHALAFDPALTRDGIDLGCALGRRGGFADGGRLGRQPLRQGLGREHARRRHRDPGYRIEPGLMSGDALGELLDQGAELADFHGQGVGGGPRPVERGVEPALRCGEPSHDLAELARQVGLAAGQIGELLAGLSLVRPKTAAGRECVVEHEYGQDRGRDGGRFRAVRTEIEVGGGTGRGCDDHHADGDENGT